MPRYYYTDPLKAAWMAREFGFKYIDRYTCDDTGRIANYTVDWKLMQEGGDLTNPIAQYELHPNSLPLLEPKVGDRNECGHILTSINPKEVYKNWLDDDDGCVGVAYYVDDGGIERDIPLKNVRIIQRDNKAFFMPEVEE